MGENGPALFEDKSTGRLLVCYSSNRPGGLGETDIYFAEEVGDAKDAGRACSRAFFASERGGEDAGWSDLWMTTRTKVRGRRSFATIPGRHSSWHAARRMAACRPARSPLRRPCTHGEPRLISTTQRAHGRCAERFEEPRLEARHVDLPADRHVRLAGG